MLQRELEEAARLARKAGELVMRVYAQPFDVAFKGAGTSDPVTEADRRANDYIVAELRRLFPGDGIVAEETEDKSDARRGGRCWYVDPLDGTKEFIAKNGEFAVMIGLAIDGEARAGVVYQPDGDKLYTGAIGEGAFLEEKGRRRVLEVGSRATPSALRLVVSRSHRPKNIGVLVDKLGLESERPCGSVGLKIGLIAEDVVDLYAHLSTKSSVWDACGPEAILRAAGGRFTDTAGDPFVYDGASTANQRGILACNHAAYDVVLPIVRDLSREAGLAD